jgi:hypothetical protein
MRKASASKENVEVWSYFLAGFIVGTGFTNSLICGVLLGIVFIFIGILIFG